MLSLVTTVVAQPVAVAMVPDADSFLRSAAPASNYGAGGALSVSGSAAVNGIGEQNGLFDTLMRFPLSNAVFILDSQLPDGWVLAKAQLLVTETAAPDNAIFNRGVGVFEVRWQAADNWVEGTGKPNPPTTDGVSWNDLAGLVNSNLDQRLGVFTNSGADGQIALDLVLGDRFVSDLRSGGAVTLHLTASTPEIGFTFNSRNFGNTNGQPLLRLTALANPNQTIDSIEIGGTNVVIRFTVPSNWSCTLQHSDVALAAAETNWSDLITFPAQPFSTNVTHVEGITNPVRFYRLRLTP